MRRDADDGERQNKIVMINISARLLSAVIGSAAIALFFAGCASLSVPQEKEARGRVERVGETLSPEQKAVTMPTLTATSPPDDFLRFALLSHPAVAASYHEWRASVDAIAPARSLPDPKLTFEADITDTLMSLMPGLMFDFMTPGKRSAMGREAAAGSEVAYRVYVNAVLQTAANVRRSWIDLAYLDEAVRLREESLAALEQSLAVARAEYVTARGMATFEGQVNIISTTGQVRSEIATLQDRRSAARARFKSALGLLPEDNDPPWPSFPLTATTLPSEADLWRRAQSSNPEIATMRAMVEMAVAGVEVARKSGTPDFAVGAMVDLKASPLMIRPTASVSLPIWREKIAATIATAEARRDVAAARVTAERLNVAAELAQMIFMVRESERMIAYLDTTALPNVALVLESAGASYQAGMSSPAMIPELQVMSVNMRLERASALRDRELAVTNLLLMVADVTPADTGLIKETTSEHAR